MVRPSSSHAHLLPQVRSLADASAAARIHHIRTDRWLSYPLAEGALAKMTELLSYPKRTRMPNMLLIGPSNNGKKMIVEKFRRDHQSADAGAASANLLHVPILKVQMPPEPSEVRFFAAIIEALGAPNRTGTLVAKQDMAMRMLRATGVRMLIIDEVHNMLSGSPEQQRRFLNLLRWLGNELQIPLVAVGIPDSLRAIQSDDQLANRFRPYLLPPWQRGADLSRLLATLEAVLPLRRPSHLASPLLEKRLLAASEGVLGEVVTIVTDAAVAAIESGAERIDIDSIEELDLTPPSKRRHAAYA